jgi:hypothetical protein
MLFPEIHSRVFSPLAVVNINPVHPAGHFEVVHLFDIIVDRKQDSDG